MIWCTSAIQADTDILLIVSSLCRARVFIDPNEDIDERFKKLRQANFKLEYKQRMGSGGRRRGAGRARVRASAGSFKAAAYDTDGDSDMD
jgi:hypothetical protein